MDLILERKAQPDETGHVSVAGGVEMLFTPPIEPDYWTYRVSVGGGQHVVGFPKFTGVGVGFALEEDWNTNLPFQSPAARIFRHIEHNRGPATATDEEIVRAIQMIREAAARDKGVDLAAEERRMTTGLRDE